MVFGNWPEAKGRRGHGAILKGAVFGGVEVNVHDHINGVRLGNEFNQREGFRVRTVNGHVLNRGYVEALVGNGEIPNSIWKFKGEFSKLVGGGGPDQSSIIRSGDLGCLPHWET